LRSQQLRLNLPDDAVVEKSAAHQRLERHGIDCESVFRRLGVPRRQQFASLGLGDTVVDKYAQMHGLRWTEIDRLQQVGVLQADRGEEAPRQQRYQAKRAKREDPQPHGAGS
jgi:hypothetical protein